jgi:hypothetical protein
MMEMKTVLSVAIMSLLATSTLATIARAASATAAPNGIYLQEQDKHHDHWRDRNRRIEHCHIRIVKHWHGNQLVVDKQKVCN